MYDLTRSLRERFVVVVVAVVVFVVVAVAGCALTELIASFVAAIAVVVEPGEGDTIPMRKRLMKGFATMRSQQSGQKRVERRVVAVQWVGSGLFRGRAEVVIVEVRNRR